MSANTHLWKNSDEAGKIRKILGVAVSLVRAQTADTHSMQNCYAWLFADYTWKHTYTLVVAAVIAAEKIAAEHKAYVIEVQQSPVDCGEFNNKIL